MYLISRSIMALRFMVFLSLFSASASAAIRDGGIDPANLGKGEWIYSMKDATNRLGGHISSVTNEVSLFKYYKSIGVRYVIIKMGTGSTNYSGCYASPHQVTVNLCNIARTNGVWVFGYTRSYGSDLPGEAALVDSVFNNGADGFVFDAEAEWESNKPWIGTNGPTLAWELLSTVRSNWPSKFIGHAPFPIISFHSTFPYKEFGYWCDAVMPQIYHFSDASYPGLGSSVSAAINWSDVNWKSWQNSLYSLATTNINGVSVNWTNAIKPITPLQDVYGVIGSAISRCNGTTGANPPTDVMEFIDYSQADPNSQTVGGYKGVNFWRADLHDAAQFGNIATGSSGVFSNVVNNIVLDDAKATRVGTWTHVLVFSATTTLPTFTGDGSGTDNNPFGTNYWTAAQGTGSAYMQYRPTILTSGDYNMYQWHPTHTNASTNVPFTITYDGGTNTVSINQTTNAGNWSFVGRFPFATGTNGTVRINDNFLDGSVAMVDGLKMVFVPPVAVPPAPTALSATPVSTAQINLAWSDNATNEVNYLVLRSTTNGGPYSIVATLPRNSTNYSDIGLTASTPYFYVIRGTNYLGATSSAQFSATTLSGATAPSISSQPQSQTVPIGTDVSFSVTAVGSTPLFYQWRFNTTNIVGATFSSYIRTNAQLSHSGNYSVLVSNSIGSTVSSNAVLTVQSVPPTITTQPTNQTVSVNGTATFSVIASGPGTLAYQWFFNGASLSGATSSTLSFSAQTTNGGNYTVVVTNASGSVTSQIAILTIFVPVPNTRLIPVWSNAPNSRPYLTTNSTERGMAFNPATGKLLLVSRANFATNIFVLNSTNGSDLYAMNLGSGIILGGLFGLSMIGAADDGAIYSANMTTDGTTANFRIYRWADDNSATTPTVAFSGNPTPGVALRWGDTFDVRGAGTDTQILAASRTGTNVAVFTTSDGVNFAATSINLSGVSGGAFGLGLAFGVSNTFWGKANGFVPLRQIVFDLATGIGTVLRSHGPPEIATTLGPLGIQPTQNLYAGLAVDTPDHLKLFDLNAANGTPILIETNNFPSDLENVNGTGSVDFGGDRVFALDSNNGIMAMQIIPPFSQITSIAVLPGGARSLLISADRGQYWIQTSSNLATWLDVTNLSNTNGTFDFLDSQTNIPLRFYRTRTP